MIFNLESPTAALSPAGENPPDAASGGGRSRGDTQRAVTTVPPQVHRIVENICLATNYLLWDEATRRMWSELHTQLEGAGFRLVLLSTVIPDPALPFPVIPIPYLMRDYASAFPGAAGGAEAVAGSDRELLENDCARARGAYPPEEAWGGLAACRGFCRTLLATLSPGFVLGWDSTSPLAVVLRALCDEAGIPFQVLERGLLPQTLMIESRGIQGWSDLRTHWLAQDMASPAGADAGLVRIREYYLTRRPQKYVQSGSVDGAETWRERWGLQRKKVVVFFGQFDACGLVPAHGTQRRYNSPEFASTQDVLIALWAAVERTPGAVLVFKPHPLDPEPYAFALASGVIMAREVNPHVLIEMADVVAAQFTTLQFEAALYGKPVLLFGRSAWWGRGAAYEVNRRGAVRQVLEEALAGVEAGIRRARAATFITWMMDQFLIAWEPGVPARRTLGDLAAFIARAALAASDQPAPEVRCQRTFSALEHLCLPSL